MNEHVERSGASAGPRQEGWVSGFPVVALVLAVVLAWVVGWYWPTVRQVTGIWWSYETFAHGLVVFPISAWLVWSKRERLQGLVPQPVAWMALPVALAGLGWAVGEFVTVNALAHLSLMAALVLAFAGVLGWTLARELAFPLGFLFFGVPIGEFLVPMLMDYTAHATVFALRLTGIPVYQEGLYFVIPSGRWSVVEACSGIRYLIASLMVGSLYAYLNYTSLRRRLIFVAVSIVVPIVANWLRAYMIVMIGHLSDNKLASGVDHLLYGWVFFGIVIGLMFWIGACWREDEAPRRPGEGRATVAAAERPFAVAIGMRALPILLVLAVFPLWVARVDAPAAPFEVVLEAPAPQPGWALDQAVFHDYTPRFSGYRGAIHQAYRRDDGSMVALYAAYFVDQRSGSQMVTSRNRLNFKEQEGPVNWQIVSRKTVEMPPGRIMNSVIADRHRTLSVWHWYWSDASVVTSDRIAKIQFAVNRLTGRADDAAFVALLIPVPERSEDARELAEAFFRDHADEIRAMLAGAEVRR